MEVSFHVYINNLHDFNNTSQQTIIEMIFFENRLLALNH